MSRHLPSLNGLRAFEAAGRHRSFTAAGQELNVTQAAVSRWCACLRNASASRCFAATAGTYLTHEKGRYHA
jgi:LysR family transcriptional regulator of beta-lactamase